MHGTTQESHLIGTGLSCASASLGERSLLWAPDRDDRWLKKGVKEAIYVHLEKPFLNRGGGLRHHLSATYNGLTLVHTWGHVIPRCHMKPGVRGKHSRVFHFSAHVTLTTHMMPSQRIASTGWVFFHHMLIFGDCPAVSDFLFFKRSLQRAFLWSC